MAAPILGRLLSHAPSSCCPGVINHRCNLFRVHDGEDTDDGEWDGPANLNEHSHLIDDALCDLERGHTGLSTSQAVALTKRYGANTLSDHSKPLWRTLIPFFWGPMPLMIECSIIITAIIQDWPDMCVLAALLFVNAIIGFLEARQTGNAVKALRKTLSPSAHCMRDGAWQSIDAKALVPGDLVLLRMGDVVPADCVLLPHASVARESSSSMLSGTSSSSTNVKYATFPSSPLDPTKSDVFPHRHHQEEGAEPMGSESAMAMDVDAHAFLELDQSALTGESLPSKKGPLSTVYSGSSVRRGEMSALVVKTGAQTFFGKAAKLINKAENHGRFQKVLFTIAKVLICIATILSAVVFTIEMIRGTESVMHIIQLCLILLIASIPIAMPAVATGTMAVGSRKLAKRGVVVTRLGAIEELASMDVLCSDKTGTLTQNELTLDEPWVNPRASSLLNHLAKGHIHGELSSSFDDDDDDDKEFIDSCDDDALHWDDHSLPLSSANDVLITMASLSCDLHSMGDSLDAIETCILSASSPTRMEAFDQIDHVAFNPVDKFSAGAIRRCGDASDGGGPPLWIAKGAPHVLFHLGRFPPRTEEVVMGVVERLASRGLRPLGVAVRCPSSATAEQDARPATHANHRTNNEPRWIYLGVLAFLDPPRVDTQETIDAALNMGVRVKMVTGDHRAIAVETASRLGLGTNILALKELERVQSLSPREMNEIIEHADGFAEVFPSHKYDVVDSLQSSGHIVGMTGDGVNDAPALKKGHVGIAVKGCTDAARAASDLVLTNEGLSVIVEAIVQSRKIFQRMRNYVIYRIAATVQILGFTFLGIVFLNVKLPAIVLVALTILNDGTIMAIAKDKVNPSKLPSRWNLPLVVLISCIVGGLGVLEAFTIQMLASHPPHHFFALGDVSPDQLKTMLYLTLSIGGQMSVFVCRTRSLFCGRRPGFLLSIAILGAASVSVALSMWWPLGQGLAPISIKDVGVVLLVCAIFLIVKDVAKWLTYTICSLWSKCFSFIVVRTTWRKPAEYVHAESGVRHHEEASERSSLVGGSINAISNDVEQTFQVAFY